MSIRFHTLKEQRDMAVHVLKARTYLDAEGKATTDESKAVSLFGTEGDEITQESAAEVGLIKKADADAATSGPEPKMLFYNGAGKKVAAGSADVASQYLDNDPARPDAPKADAAAADDGAAAGDQGATKAELLEQAEAAGLDLPKSATKAQIQAALDEANAGSDGATADADTATA